MCSVPLDRVKKQYIDAFEKHGRGDAAILTPKGRYPLRYDNLLSEFDLNGATILDYGCGLGNLYRYLLPRYKNFTYIGADMVEEFVKDNRKRHPEATFLQISDTTRLAAEVPRADIVVCCGVFNVMYVLDETKHWEIVRQSLRDLWSIATVGLAVDFMSSYVDFRVEDAFHVEPHQVLHFCQTDLSRFTSLNHMYLPYEFCVRSLKPDLTMPDAVSMPEAVICSKTS